MSIKPAWNAWCDDPDCDDRSAINDDLGFESAFSLRKYLREQGCKRFKGVDGKMKDRCVNCVERLAHSTPASR